MSPNHPRNPEATFPQKTVLVDTVAVSFTPYKLPRSTHPRQAAAAAPSTIQSQVEFWKLFG